MTQRNIWIMGNWKTNPVMTQDASNLAQQLAGAVSKQTVQHKQMMIAPGVIHASTVATHCSEQLWLMGQDCCAYTQTQGAYTGDISAAQLAELGAKAVLVGHSERRQYHQESSELLTQKIKHVTASGMLAVLCVGESLSEREAKTHFDVVAQQITSVLQSVTLTAAQIVIAYEPVWAIGTGRTASPEQAQEVHAAIRVLLAKFDTEIAEKTQILYGGSMNPKNASALLSMSDIDGGLIGGASLKADDFLTICQAA